MKCLFGGVVADGLITPYPEPSRTDTDQVHALLDSFRRFATKHVDSARIDADEAIGADVLFAMKELGLFGLLVPKEHGGAGLAMSGYARIIQEAATVDASIAVTLSAHQSLGTAPILLFGSDELRAKYLPRLATGDLLAAFALTEIGAGSDAAALRTRADRDGEDFVLSGEKVWVTNGGMADLFTVFARTSPADEGAKPRLTAFLVERGPGVTTGESEPKLGMRGLSTTPLRLDSVRVPASHVLGEVGRGYKVAMEILMHARLGLATACIGASKRFLRLAVERASERKAFGRNIAEFGLVRDRIAQMTSDIFAVESATYLATGLAESGRSDFSVESAICKVFASETLTKVANDAMQIAAGIGYMRASPYERLLRDARFFLVFQGTNDILRCFIALSGMQGPGREIEEVSRAMREPIKGFGLLSDFAMRKAKSALSRERFTRAHPSLAHEVVLFEEYTSHLAKNVDKVLRRHGKNIAEMQFTQRRIANVAIDLYAIASVIARTTRAIERRGEEGARRESDLASVFVAGARKRLSDAVASFDENDDELRKAIAQKTCADGGYPLDVL